MKYPHWRQRPQNTLVIMRHFLRDDLHIAPGNPGMVSLGTCHKIDAEDTLGLFDLACSLAADGDYWP